MSKSTPQEFNPILADMYCLIQVRKTVLTLVLLVGLATFLQNLVVQLGLGLHFTRFLLSTGCVAVWNGIMMRDTHPRASRLHEQAGIVLVFLAYNMLVASLAPKVVLVWYPALCLGFFILPLVMEALPRLAAG